MSIETSMEMSKNRTSFICIRAAEIRKGKDIEQHDAMIQAHKEYENYENNIRNCWQTRTKMSNVELDPKIFWTTTLVITGIIILAWTYVMIKLIKKDS